MFQVLEDTPNRLAFTLSAGALNSAACTFDKTGNRALFERKTLFWKHKPVEVALDDIVAIAPVRIAPGSPRHRPLVQLKAGAPLRLPEAGTETETIAAIDRMRAYLGLPEPEALPASPVTTPAEAPAPAAPETATASAAPAAAKPRSRAYRWVVGTLSLMAAIAILVLAATRLYNLFTLPECDEERTRKTIREIFEEKKVKLESLRDFKALTSTREERTCQARADVEGGYLNLDYRLDWDGWSARVTITRADAVATIAPARLDEIKKATAEFLALARDSHSTGRPPRQSDPTVKALLDKVFDTAELEGVTLALSDIDKAMEWFNAGDRIGVVYILAGTGVSDIARLPNDPTVQRRTQRNVADFAPEFARYLDFEVRLAQAMADAQLKRMADASADEIESPRVRKELTEVRTTLAEAITGDLTSLAYGGVSDDWRRDRLALLNKAAPTAAKFLLPSQARALREHALKVATYVANPALQDRIRAFADAVSPP